MFGSLQKTVVRTVLSFLEIFEDSLLGSVVWENNSDLQSPASTRLVGLQSLVPFWKGMGNKVILGDGKTLKVDDKEYKLTPGLVALITLKHPRPNQWNFNDYRVCNELVAQTKIKSFLNRTGTARPHATWKWKHMLKKMVMPVDRIE